MSVFDNSSQLQKGGVPIQDTWFDRGLTSAQEDAAIAAIGSWYLNYLPTTDDSSPGFVPQIFDHAHCTSQNVAASRAVSDTVLTFNEPDHADQANMTVAQAAADWPTITAGNFAKIVSPSIGGSLTTHPNWLDNFLADASAPHVDAIGVHTYTSTFNDANAAASATMNYFLQIYNYYRKPLYVLEFGMIGFQPGGLPNWLFPSQAQAVAYILNLVPRMRTTAWIERFVWYPGNVLQTYIDQNAGYGNIQLINQAGALTIVGQAYRDAIQIRHYQAANTNGPQLLYALAQASQRRRRRRGGRPALAA